MKKAVFLDRDGVINEDVHHLNSVSKLRILPGVAIAIKNLNERGYQIVVVTNQGAIAKDLLRESGLKEIHKELVVRLAKEGARIDGIYYCPHHTDGSIPEYSIVCDCRKPAPGMIRKAVEDLDIDLRKSFLVGDKYSDILAGNRMGLITILVKSEYMKMGIAEEGATPDFFVDDLLAATHYIL